MRQLAVSIQNRLAELNISARQACLTAGLREDSIRTIFNGHAPRITAILQLAQVLNLPIATLFGAGSTAANSLYSPDGYIWAKRITDYASISSDGELILFPILLLADHKITASPMLLLSTRLQFTIKAISQVSETVLIDPSQRTPGPLGLAIRDGDAIRIRGLHIFPGNCPDAGSVTPERFPLPRSPDIVGKVLWSSRATSLPTLDEP
jgi:transcriptional regulator with XRE-family HTH domain